MAFLCGPVDCRDLLVVSQCPPVECWGKNGCETTIGKDEGEDIGGFEVFSKGSKELVREAEKRHAEVLVNGMYDRG